MNAVASLIRRAAVPVLCLVLMQLAGGCGGYVLQGRVVQADFSMMTFVPATDARLSQPGVPNVQVKLFRDADKPNVRVVATQVSDGAGQLAMPVGEFGAGWLVEQWRIEASRSGYQSADTMTALPAQSKDMRLLIMLAPGYSPGPGEDVMEQYERFK